MFGLSQAKESIRMADRAVVVEGNLDVVSSHQAGVEMVVATAGFCHDRATFAGAK